MKNKITKLLKFGLTLFTIGLLLTNCENEQIQSQEETSKNQEKETLVTEEVSISQIPEVKSYLDKNPLAVKTKVAKNSLAKNGNNETDFGEVDFSKILKTTDSLGKITYTFRMLNSQLTDDSESPYFDNLVIELVENETEYKPYILRYFYGEDPETSQYNYKGFSGHIKRFPLSKTSFGLDFLNSGLTSKSSCRIEIETDCGLQGHHQSLDEPGCTSHSLYVTIYTFCDIERTLINSGSYSSQTTTTNPRNGGSSGTSSPIITPYNEVVLAMYDTLKKKLALTNKENTWLMSQENHFFAIEILFGFLSDNGWDTPVINLANQTIDILRSSILTETQKLEQFEIAYDNFDPLLSLNDPISDYEAKIRKSIQYFRWYGNDESKEFANYLESLLPLNDGFSKDDYYALYKTIRVQTKNLTKDYLWSIVGVTIESFQPVIEMALWEVGGGLALKALSKLPVRFLTTPIKNVISRLASSTSEAFSNLKHAKKYGITSYKGLKGIFSELGIAAKAEGVEFHHLFEQRFVTQLESKLGANTDEWLSIVVDKTKIGSEHYNFTQAWKSAIGYDGQALGWTNKTTSTATFDDIIRAAREIYKEYPEILTALGI